MVQFVLCWDDQALNYKPPKIGPSRDFKQGRSKCLADLESDIVYRLTIGINSFFQQKRRQYPIMGGLIRAFGKAMV